METPVPLNVLEALYESTILPQFGLSPEPTTWLLHKRVGPDSEAHVLERGSKQFVLLYEDYPTLPPEEVAFQLNPARPVQLQAIPRDINGDLREDKGALNTTPDAMTLRFGPSTVPSMHAHNITGYYKLFEITDGTPVDNPVQARQRLAGESGAYSALVTIGLELVALAQHTPNHRHIEQMAFELAALARHSHFDDLHNLFFDIYMDECGQAAQDYQTTEEYFRGIKTSLEELASEKHINPAVSVADQELLNTHTLPIHRHMMEHPEQSPELFRELATTLDRLIDKQQLSYWAAGQELSFALDRPQIADHEKLAPMVQKAYTLALPNTLVRGDVAAAWREFMQSLTSASLTD